MDSTRVPEAWVRPDRQGSARAEPAPLSSDRTTPPNHARNRPKCDAGVTIYGDGPDGPRRVNLPCGKRRCPACRPRWIKRGHLMMAAGIDPWAETDDFREMCLTAPGFDQLRSVDQLVEWNRSHGERVNRFLKDARRLAPDLAFVRVLELQKRGAIHSHWIVRGADHLAKRQIVKLALAAGFGPKVSWSKVRTMEGLQRYLVGYMMKSRDVFPAGTRVIVASQNWAQEARGSDGGLAPGGLAAVDGELEPEEFYPGPPPGMSWREWAEDPALVTSARAIIRRRRRIASARDFESATRDRFFRWLASDRGQAAQERASGPP